MMSATETRPSGASEPPRPPDGFERRPNRWPLIALGAIVVVAFFAVGAKMFTRSVAYYRTPTEVLTEPGAHVRLSGTVVPGTIATDTSVGTVTFAVTDDTTDVTVIYSGPRPDTLQDGGEAVAEGSLSPDGRFVADTLFAKCPSKFETQDQQAPPEQAQPVPAQE
jgi:cytochrome c-type biogenesis protein CcmE